MIVTRRLSPRLVDGVTLLDAVEGDDVTRLFFGKGLPPDRIALPDGSQKDAVQGVAGSIAIRLPARAGPLAWPVSGVSATAHPTPPEPDLLAGMHVMMGERNGQSAALIAEWLRYHVGEQGADAALILDRARPDEAPLGPALTEALAAHPIAGLRRVVIVTSDTPLGEDAISARHPLQAPDAPGKDRMTAPAPDPWTAPLASLILWEALRWRFLTGAAGVVFLDVSDVLAPAPAGRRAFDLLAEAPDGFVALVGRRIYPWRIRKSRDAHFGDHICDRFDNPGGNRRWAAAPARLPEDHPFRLVRVGGLKPDPERIAAFYRAMAVRVSEAEDVPLAPKSSLVADDDLLTFARASFDADPVLPPTSAAPTPRGLPATLPGRTAVVTCMKNEGPFILEWIAYHRAIGVDDFLVYTNDCTDGTDTLLDLLASHDIVTHRDNPFRGTDLKPQHAALDAAESEPIMARAAWAICMDVDEFINVHAGDGHLRDLYAAVGDANMISLTWRLFGNADLADFDDRPTPARFDRCAPEVIRKPHQAWGFKTLFRNEGLYRKMGVHRPKGLKPDLWDRIRWVNGSGQPMPKDMLRTGWRSTLDTYGYGLVTLNHYAVRDAESFLVKRDRGRVNHVDRDQGLGYWFRMNNNAERETSIQRMLPKLEAERARLLALPGVADQHAACVAAHRAKITELRAADAFADFYAEITGDRLRRLSRMHRNFGANVFLAGPDSVPEDIWRSDPDEDFFFTVGEVDTTSH